MTLLQQIGHDCLVCNTTIDATVAGYPRICNDCEEEDTTPFDEQWDSDIIIEP